MNAGDAMEASSRVTPWAASTRGTRLPDIIGGVKSLFYVDTTSIPSGYSGRAAEERIFIKQQ